MASGSSLTADKILQLTLAEEDGAEFEDESDDEFLTESRSDFIDISGTESLYPDDLLSSSNISLLFRDGCIPQPAERDSVLRDDEDDNENDFESEPPSNSNETAVTTTSTSAMISSNADNNATSSVMMSSNTYDDAMDDGGNDDLDNGGDDDLMDTSSTTSTMPSILSSTNTSPTTPSTASTNTNVQPDQQKAKKKTSKKGSKKDEWEWQTMWPSCVPPQLKFTGSTSGPKGIAVGVTDPLACFHLFLPHEMYDDILVQTNLYASQQLAKKNNTTPFYPITKCELMAFIGMNIAMGIISLPSIKDYWSSNPILRHNWFSTVMSRKRFLEILRFFHIVDNTTAPSRSDPNYNRLWKIQPIISILQDTCGELYSPHEQLSIDESMIGTKCRLSFIQYIKAKPVKWGIKVWICSDSTNGYISSFDVYTGKDPAKPLHSHGLAHGVVLSLLDKFLGKGYTVYTDNFYTSPLLCEDLLQKGIFSCGTVRTNKKQFPKLLIDKSKKLNRGEHIFCHHGHVTAVKWQDRREMYAMCTKVTNDVTQVKRRNSDGPGRIDVPCPKMIEQYNKFMGGGGSSRSKNVLLFHRKEEHEVVEKSCVAAS